MKKLVLVVILIFTLCGVVDAKTKKWRTLRVGVEGGYPPFSYIQPDGELAGFDIDIAKAIGKVLKVEIVFVVQEWNGMIPSLIAKKYDVIISSMSITEDRKRKVNFSRKYYYSPTRFICKRDIVFREFSPNTIKNMTIGVQRDTVHDRYITNNYPNSEIKRYSTQEIMYDDLINHRLDIVVADGVALATGFLKTPQGKKFNFVGPILDDPEWFGEGVGIAFRKTDDELERLLNISIDIIRANGTYKVIQDKYFDFDIYGK